MVLSLSDSFYNYRVYGLTITSNLPLDPWLPLSEEPASLAIEGWLASENLPVLPLRSARHTEQSGAPHSSFYHNKTLRLNIPRVGHFLIAQDKILVQFSADANLASVCANLLSTALSLWLEQHRTRVIHASCLVYHGKAAAFMANSTTGKSTLAAAFLQSGAELLSDDVVPIVETANGFFASPGYPTVRLSEEQIEYFLGTQANLARWFPKWRKALIPIGENGWGGFCNLSQKIQRLYVLNRTLNDPGGQVRFEPLSDVDSVLSLIRFSFLIRDTWEMEIAAERMAFFARLVAQTGVTRLTYSSGYEHLTEVIRQVFGDMDKNEVK
ncbi:MAG: hypothetical protein JW730_11525 [Anaerolineales bacterium]|nr:hypothetical protein [Anaerolineales bacterium]